jgi:hypothetical protein
MSNSHNDKKERLLISLNRGYEADLVKGSLESANIPFYTKEHSGPAGFSRFDTQYDKGDIEFYVHEEMLDKAKAVLPPVTGVDKIQKELAEKESAADDALKENGDSEKKSDEKDTPAAKRKSTIFAVVFVVLAIAVIFGVDAIMNYLRAVMGWA